MTPNDVQSIESLLAGIATLALIGFAFWVMIGRPHRRRERVEENKRKGGRKPESKGFWALPRRDRNVAPWIATLTAAMFALARHLSPLFGGVAGQSMVMFSLVLAGAAAFRPDLVKLGVGVIGLGALFAGWIARGAPLPDVEATASSEAFVLTVAILLMFVFAMFVTPIQTAARVPARIVRTFLSPGTWLSRPGGRGVFGSRLASLFLALEVGLVMLDPLRRDAVVDLLALDFGFYLLLVAGAVIAVGAALLPDFTGSVLGVGLLMVELLFLMQCMTLAVGVPACAGSFDAALYALMFLGTALVLRRIA